MNLSLAGKTALICGSTQGIGLAAAIELSMLGASCVLLARNETALVQVTGLLDTSFSQKHSWYSADFTDSASLRSAIERIVAVNTIEILINNTGGPPAGPVAEATADAFLKAFEQHLVNNQLLAQAVLPAMKNAGYGRIINIISTSVKIPIDNLGVSNTIRAAVASWAKTLSNEVAQFNITVNSVLPGFTKTQRLKSLVETNALKTGLTTAALEKKMQDGIPMKRFGEASEIAAVVAFLASPAASYVNGISIPVDGGKTGTI